MPIPTSLIFIILGIIVLIICTIQNKKSNEITKAYLFLGVLFIFLGIIPGILLLFQEDNFIDKNACEKLNEAQCIEHQDACSLCGETAILSYAGCHSIEFCKNISAQLEDQINAPYSPTAREQAIEQYLLSQKQFNWKTIDNSHNFCAIKNLKSEQELFPLYIWAYCGEYIIEDGKLKTISGSFVPAKIDYPNELSYYDINKFSHKVPRDGAYYTKDIKKIFPEDIQQKIFNHDAVDLITAAENYAFANIYNWNLIKQAIADCEIKSVMQTHALEISATFKDDKEIIAKESEIDEVFDVINKNREKCGEIIMATE